jgi:hypothetical protein
MNVEGIVDGLDALMQEILPGLILELQEGAV